MSRHAKLVAATFAWIGLRGSRASFARRTIRAGWRRCGSRRRGSAASLVHVALLFVHVGIGRLQARVALFAYQCLEASERACTWRLQQRQRPTARARSFFINVLLGSVTVLSNRREATKFRSAIVGILSLGIECEDCLTYVVEAVQPRSPMAAGRQRNNRQGACSGKRAGRCLRPDAQRKGPLSKSRGRA
jgi:hypothetical protein